jgi:hypothetical protein
VFWGCIDQLHGLLSIDHDNLDPVSTTGCPG